jgi:hypothetical protein
MKRVIYIDQNGYKRCVLLRDTDRDELARKGIPVPMPNIDDLDWNAIKLDLHNELVSRGLYNWHDVQTVPDGIVGSILFALKNRIIALYRENKEQ